MKHGARSRERRTSSSQIRGFWRVRHLRLDSLGSARLAPKPQRGTHQNRLEQGHLAPRGRGVEVAAARVDLFGQMRAGLRGEGDGRALGLRQAVVRGVRVMVSRSMEGCGGEVPLEVSAVSAAAVRISNTTPHRISSRSTWILPVIQG